MISFGADIQAKDLQGHNAMHYAVQNGHTSVVAILNPR
jgi:ankyrin repeat protein